MKVLHLVSFDVPFPPDYGGASSVFQLLNLLQTNGIHVILHVYTYRDRKVTEKLKELCFRVYEYKRILGFSKQLSFIPYIVNSRNAPELLNNLAADQHPVLFEGIHTTKYLTQLLKYKNNLFLRAHNYESAYYAKLAHFEHSFFRKLYFKLESFRLKPYEALIAAKVKTVFCFTDKDASTFNSFGAKTMIFNPNILNIPLDIKEGRGTYLLIHANLSINDNVHSSLQLIKQIAPGNGINIKVAGKNPTPYLIEEISKYQNVEIIPNPSEKDLITLLQNAHIHLCFSEISEGFKIRVRTVLQYGRFILSNNAFCEDKAIQEMMIMENDLSKWPMLIVELMQRTFDNNAINSRQDLLNKLPKGHDVKELIDIVFEKASV